MGALVLSVARFLLLLRAVRWACREERTYISFEVEVTYFACCSKFDLVMQKRLYFYRLESLHHSRLGEVIVMHLLAVLTVPKAEKSTELWGWRFRLKSRSVMFWLWARHLTTCAEENQNYVWETPQGMERLTHSVASSSSAEEIALSGAFFPWYTYHVGVEATLDAFNQWWAMRSGGDSDKLMSECSD